MIRVAGNFWLALLQSKDLTRRLELPYQADSLEYCERVIDLPYPVLLSSAASPLGRYDILSADPVEVIESDTDVAAHIQAIADAVAAHTTPPNSQHPAQTLPFVAGAIGLLAYQAGEALVGIDRAADSRWPAVHAGIYQWALVQDHHLQKTFLVADAKLPGARWQALCELMQAPLPNGGVTNAAMPELHGEWIDSLPWPQYCERFSRLQDYIASGDCYQANLTRELSIGYSGDAWPVLGKLQQRTAAPFTAFMRRPEADLVSASPERFVHVERGVATSQPIKGSRPRGASANEDAMLIAELVASEKDRAENLMIVDLLRNDFGRCCVTGSVYVPELFRVQSFSNVHHLVSTVCGELPDATPAQALHLLATCMPGGSITGAPKKRAMEIIAELEPHQRSVYCGALFYLDRNGNMDSNILIRTLLFEKSQPAQAGTGRIYCWSGGGIVADSGCEEEFAESGYKVQHLRDILAARVNDGG